jgi:hypothetical protein
LYHQSPTCWFLQKTSLKYFWRMNKRLNKLSEYDKWLLCQKARSWSCLFLSFSHFLIHNWTS